MSSWDQEDCDEFSHSYILICPELDQAQCPAHYGDCYSFQQFLDPKNEIWFFNTFAKPVASAQRIQHYQPPATAGSFALERVPNEVINMIVDYLFLRVVEQYYTGIPTTNLEDVLSLGLASARLWPVILDRIHRGYRRRTKPDWAGKKVAFYGRNSRMPDTQIQYYGLNRPVGKHQRSRFVVGTWDWNYVGSQPEERWRSLTSKPPSLYHVPRLRAAFDRWDREMIQHDVSEMYMYPQIKVWVLRNLTTRQIVRSDQLQKPRVAAPDWDPPPPKPSASALQRLKMWLRRLWNTGTRRRTIVHNPEDSVIAPTDDPRPLTLANIFLVLTCSANSYYNTWYPSGSTTSPAYPECYLVFEHGPWAGCAFDVVTLEDHVQSLQQDDHREESIGWADVSKEVVADLANLQFVFQKHKEFDWKGSEAVEIEAFWDRLRRTRRAHHRWIEMCPERPWVDESPYD